MLASIRLENGDEIPTDHLFSVQGSEPNTALARALGVQLSANGSIQVDT